MISARFAPAVVVLLALALVPTVIHSYRGMTVDDGLTAAVIPDVLDGLPSQPTDRRAAWVENNFQSRDWFERTYNVGGQSVRLFVARSYDLKRLYHHPELAVLRGLGPQPAGRGRLPGRPDVPVQVLRLSAGDREGLAMYALAYQGEYVERPLLLQVRTSGALLFSGRRAMTLLMASQLPGPVSPTEGAPAVRVLRAAVDAFDRAMLPQQPAR